MTEAMEKAVADLRKWGECALPGPTGMALVRRGLASRTQTVSFTTGRLKWFYRLTPAGRALPCLTSPRG